VVIEHLAAGKRAVFVENGKIVLAQGTAREPLCEVSAIAMTEFGRNLQQTRYVLAAVAAAWALELPMALILAGLEGY
jgi:cyanophycin synthetase